MVILKSKKIQTKILVRLFSRINLIIVNFMIVGPPILMSSDDEETGDVIGKSMPEDTAITIE